MDIFETKMLSLHFNYHCVKKKNVSLNMVFTYYLN